MAKRRALLSVSDKTGIVDLALALRGLDFEIIASGGTSKALEDAGVEHSEVAEVTGFPEMLDGRVKTMHPRIHGGILADRFKPSHLASLNEHGISLIDLVVCNLYPFNENPSIELIDIGGPSLLRAAAKNYAHVGVIVDVARYRQVVDELSNNGELCEETKFALAGQAFAHTAAYDRAISSWFTQSSDPSSEKTITLFEDGNLSPHANSISLNLTKSQDLRYGENPHQSGALYRFNNASSWWDSAQILGGKELSYLNVYDTDAAWRLVHDLIDRPCVAIIKHANPAGVACGENIATAYQLAYEGDPVSAFGGIVAANREVSDDMAKLLVNVFTEVIVAPAYSAGALDILKTKKNLRILQAKAPIGGDMTFRSVDGGLLVQQVDRPGANLGDWSRLPTGWTVPTNSQPADEQLRDLLFTWVVCAHVKSNAIVVGKNWSVFGVGAGQQSRVDSVRIALTKAGERSRGAVAASDAFFPFPDGVELLAQAGVRAIVSPGGSVRDSEVVDVANKCGVALVFTGTRHFLH